ncbi:MAG: hypothetical protein GXO75_17635 [Calditrichaeota bacterium]|nr:hypothetical protein [Calditrichota bacterium]
MKQSQKLKQRKEIIKSWLFFVASLAFTILLLLIFPDRQTAVLKSSWQIFMEMIVILPAVMLLIGFFAVWVPNEMVVKLLGKTSGIKGIGLSLLFGALPTGPLYIAFPLSAALISKGARVSNIVIFLSAWACIKIPQEMVELQFLGVRFMALRLGLTIIFVIIMGVFIEQIVEPKATQKGKK